jgi:hypothetical protein
MQRHKDIIVNAILRRRYHGRVFISGTGRAGTTLLVQLMSDLGLNTGFSSETAATGDASSGPSRYFEVARAGLERDPFDPQNPFIVKSPFLCDFLPRIVASGIDIDHIFIPIRRLEDAAESRRLVQAQSHCEPAAAPVPGGLFGTDEPEKQDLVLAQKLYRLVYNATCHNIPMTFLDFPRFAYDADYAFAKLQGMLPLTSRSAFKAIHSKRVRRDLIHDFEKLSTAE